MSDKKRKTVLAFDTAMGGVSVGLNAKNGHTVSRMMETQREQARFLVPMIQEVMEEAGTPFKDIDLIVSTVGPGSFTGLRIGLSTARTLGVALEKPVVGLLTLDVIAEHYNGALCPQTGGGTEKALLIVLETKRQDFYARYYSAQGEEGREACRTPLGDAFAADASEVLNRAPVAGFDVGGDCLKRFQGCVSGDFKALKNWLQPDPILMAQMGLKQFEAGGEVGMPQPLYLREADVSHPKNPPRVLIR